MKKILFCFSLLVAFHFSSAQKTTPKGKLVIIGGGSRPDAMVDRIIAEAGLKQGGYGIILPMSSADPDSAVYYASQQFVKKGINSIYGVIFKKGETLTPQKVDSVRNAKLIYISGGDQTRFMGVVQGTDIEKAIRDAYMKGSIVGGTSAGAAVMSKIMITGDELKHPEYSSTFRNIEEANIETKPGLGLVEGVIIDQHFVKRSRYNRLISAIIEYPLEKGIGIDEATAIIVSGNTAEVIGDSQVIVFENPKRSKVVTNGKLSAKGLTLNIYVSGEKFSLK
ncbi:cyanophycinase [Chryseolinea lacunae]|uniref:Cyanophycinase n=1 Tax=Chryseolinea lacunae TaxID=2801331 RepID=A0ABS1L0V9_9BACT|nr:cyanophycinase [Chryseolinea lacunae]MBL0745279.1 cyanophycinase [Chryseolinea lacunae]